MNKTVLVTGGAGYVGAHGCKALAATAMKGLEARIAEEKK